MKIIIKQLLLLSFIAFTIGGCIKDLGNYDIKEIRELEIIVPINASTGKDTVYSLITKIDTLKIVPDIVMSEGWDFKEEDYEYSWNLVLNDELNEISTEKNLVYPIDLAVNSYSIYLFITDKETEVKYNANYIISVSNLYSSGILVLTEDDQSYAKLDMVSMVKDTIVFKDILSSSGVPMYKNPIFIYKGIYPRNNEIHIFTQEGDYLVDPTSFNHNPNMDFLKYKMAAPRNTWPNGIASYVIDPTGRGDRTIMVDGNIFPYDAMLGSLYGYPINMYINNPKLIKVAPQYMTSFKRTKSYSRSYVLYDLEQKRFIKYNSNISNGSACDSLRDNALDVAKFKWKTDMDYVTSFHSFFGINGDITTILKNGNEYYAYRYDIDMSYYQYSKKGRYNISDAEHIASAKNHFASATQAYIFYTYGSKIYGYDLELGQKGAMIMDMGAEITAVYDAPTYSKEKGKNIIYVATYGGTPGSGKITKLQIEDNPSKMSIVKALNPDDTPIVWSGFDKVVMMTHK